VARHDDRDDQAARQGVPLAALGLDQAHGLVLAPRVGVGFVLGRVDEDHADALAHGACDLAVEIVAAAQLLGIDKQFVFVVEVGFEIAAQGVGQGRLEALHQRVSAVGITEETTVTDCHACPLVPGARGVHIPRL
jgi:hypothetical protein